MDSLALGALVCTLPANIHPKPCPSAFILGSTTYCNQGLPLHLGVVLLVPVLGDLLEQGLPLYPVHGIDEPVAVADRQGRVQRVSGEQGSSRQDLPRVDVV